jgi:hypothetical protein
VGSRCSIINATAWTAAASAAMMLKAFIEVVPAFVELESGGPPPGACRVVGHG